jgi:DNA phosphorothioation-associated putative methyltransferase
MNDRIELENPPEIESHKAAIPRGELSRPVRLALETDIINESTTFFDYGCGWGGDVERLRDRQIEANGWDPHYYPENSKLAADVVNIGYIINVILEPAEREIALKNAWDLTRSVLIVAAQVLVRSQKESLVYGDGIITQRNTFQKYYIQDELKTYIDTTLQVNAVPISLGIFFVFRDDLAAEAFRASRLYSLVTQPRVRILSQKFADYQPILQPLMDFIGKRGRLPLPEEFRDSQEILQIFGSLKRAFKVIIAATDEVEWDRIAYIRSLDLQIYLALAQFGKRRTISQMPPEIRADIKAFFGTFNTACEVADEMLFSLGKPGIIRKLCRRSPIGKILPKSFYIHRSALNELDPKLRLYEGCASSNVGGLQDANIIKFSFDSPTISYLTYPDFDTIDHPVLTSRMAIDLRDLSVSYTDYSDRLNPPILHRKETFLSPNHPLYQSFAELTQSEVAAGLLDESATIGTKLFWEKRLAAMADRDSQTDYTKTNLNPIQHS